jgi:hypothetical protein
MANTPLGVVLLSELQTAAEVSKKPEPAPAGASKPSGGGSN